MQEIKEVEPSEPVQNHQHFKIFKQYGFFKSVCTWNMKEEKGIRWVIWFSWWYYVQVDGEITQDAIFQLQNW